MHGLTGTWRTIVVMLTLGASVAFGADDDYLSPGLRDRVETLKAEVAASATDPANHEHRARILWDWANAYALDGGYLPVNLTAVLRPGVLDPATAAGFVDAYVAELSMLDEDPNALGSLEADSGPFEARSWASFQQRWTVGSEPLEAGGGVIVARHFMLDGGEFQAMDPAGDNYVSIRSSDPGVRFEVDTAPMTGMHGGFRGAAPALLFRVAAGTLDAGDVVTVTYGDRSGGSRGLLMPTFSSDRMPFPLYLLFEPAGHPFSLPIQPIRVSGTTVAGVHGFAPSVVRPGEPFDLSVRAEDRYYNRAVGPLPAWRLEANGAPLASIPAGPEPLTVLDSLVFDTPGVYWIDIRSADSSIAGDANPILVSADAPRVFWGDTHGHSGFAEGIGTPERFMTWARDDARLDFVTHSEHDIWLDDAEWQVLEDNVGQYSEPGRFVAFLGYEWTTANRLGGHHNVLFRTATGRERIATQFHPTLSRLYQGLRQQHDTRDVVVIPHAHQAGDYRLSDPALEPLVEIMSQHGTFEWFGRMYLNHGHQVGFTAASDNHLSQPGYTSPKGGSLSQRGGLGAVFAAERSRDAIFDAMRGLAAYATSGERMLLDVTINGARMGKRIPFAERRVIAGRVIGTAPIETITVVKNDRTISHRNLLEAEATPPGEEETLFLTFHSDSMPLHPRDNPRGWRPWEGSVRVQGARLAAAETLDVASPSTRDLRRENDVVHFRTSTRGDYSTVRLELEDIGADACLELNLSAGREFGGAPPIYRPHQPIPPARLTLLLTDLADGSWSRSLPLEVYEDTITVRRLISDGERDVRFELQDQGTTQGDYYFVRVKQVDDAEAWSSPIWVGGHPPR